jgi:hypothetical protein
VNNNSGKLAEKIVSPDERYLYTRWFTTPDYSCQVYELRHGRSIMTLNNMFYPTVTHSETMTVRKGSDGKAIVKGDVDGKPAYGMAFVDNCSSIVNKDLPENLKKKFYGNLQVK